MNNILTKSVTLNDVYAAVDRFIAENRWLIQDGCIRIIPNYDEQLSLPTIKEIMEANCPADKLLEILYGWAEDYSYGWGYETLCDDIRNSLTDEERDAYDENEPDVREYVEEHVCFYYAPDDFDRDICINIGIDCGNGIYEYVEDNVLNWYGMTGGSGDMPDESSMLWLAKTQGRDAELRKACRIVHDGGDFPTGSRFIETAVEELYNMPSYMGTLTFLVKVKLSEAIKIQSAINNGQGGYIVVGKTASCGLYDPCNGGGSLLGVELEKDVRIPVNFISLSVDGCRMNGYDVGDVYGLCESEWKEALKQIVTFGNAEKKSA
jgi:hypothetical protein